MPRIPLIYNDRDSIIHQRDDRIKILVFVILVGFLYVAPTWQWMLGMTVIGLLLAVVARVSKRWLLVLWLLQLPNIIVLILAPLIDQLLTGNLTFEGNFAFGIKLALAWSAALFVSISLLSSMSVDQITDGLRGLGLPEVICFTVGYTFLLIYLSINDIFHIADAMKVKGLDLETKNPFRLMKSLPRLMIPTIITVVRRAMTMMAVLQIRGFSASKRRQRKNPPKFDVGDGVFLTGGLIILGAAFAARLGLFPTIIT
ncbi:MAG: energy-coupling factor transporter transmembrane protein EcfT [Halothece sp.]